jgi:hypothetical protein
MSKNSHFLSHGYYFRIGILKFEIQDGGLLQINRNTLINNKPYEDKREKVNGVDVEEKPPSS